VGDKNVYYFDSYDDSKPKILLPEADAKSFELINYIYAKDINNIYYRFIYCSRCLYGEHKIIKDLNVQNVRFLTDSILTDGNLVYFGATQVKVDNPKDLRKINDYYLEDGVRVYSTYNIDNEYEKELGNEDPKDFNILYDGFAEGKAGIYHNGILLDVSPKTFKAVDGFVGYDNEKIIFIEEGGINCQATRPFNGVVEKISDYYYKDASGQIYEYSVRANELNSTIKKYENVDKVHDDFNCFTL